MTFFTKILLGFAAIALVIVLGVAEWQFRWFLAEKNLDRQVQLDNRNVGTQTARHDRAIRLVNQAALLPEGPQRSALEREACDYIGRLVEDYLTDDLAVFQAQECS